MEVGRHLHMPKGLLPLAAAALLALSLPALVAAHGYLKYPISRNYAANLLGLHYCPHCGQGGGQYKTPSICGDPFQDRPAINYSTPATYFGLKANLTEGAALDVTVHVATNHGGRMALRVCPLDRSAATQECFDNPAHQLRRVSPDPAYHNKLYWYVPAVPDYTDITTTWRLPAGVSCAGGCIMQWWWVAYQFCALPCQRAADDVASECGRNLVFPVGTCAELLQTEQFYNCADVKIDPASSTGNPTSPPASPQPPSPPPAQPAQSPSPRPPSPSPRPPSPSPPPPSPPSSPGSAACPSTEYDCQMCSSNGAAAQGALPGMTPPCHTCAAALADGWGCYNCLAAPLATTNPDVMRGCFDCVARGVNGWACRSVCAASSPDAATMEGCVGCYQRAAAANNWGCNSCFTATPDAAKRAACFACVADDAPTWACGDCARNYASACEVQQCAACLRSSPAGAWGCTVASYAAACAGRRLLRK